MKLRHVLLLFMCTLLVAPDAYAQRRKLQAGSDAPGLKVEKWLTGEAVGIEDGKVSVVLFMNSREFDSDAGYDALLWNVVLLSVAEQDGLNFIIVTEKDTESVHQFIVSLKHSKQYNFDAEQLKIHIAVDKKQATNRAWVKAADQKVTPLAFVIDKKGKIAWITNFFDEWYYHVVWRIMVDRWDYKKIEKTDKFITQAGRDRRLQNWRMASNYFDQVIESDPRTFWLRRLRNSRCS